MSVRHARPLEPANSPRQEVHILVHRPRRGRGINSSWLFITPAVILFAGVVVFGVAFNIVESLQSPAGGFSFTNYMHLLNDGVVWGALANNVVWFVVTVIVQLVVGYTLAITLELCHVGARFIRGIVVMPVVLSPVVVSIVWSQIYDPANGILATIQRALGLGSPIAWLASPKLALLSVAVVNVWQWTGFSMLLGRSAIRNIPRDLIEAAQVDGASPLLIARKILLPLMRPATVTLLILGTIGSLQAFGLIFVMTNGGPGDSSQVLGTYIYKVAFSENQFSYGSAVSVLLLVITFIVTAVELHFIRRLRDV